MLELRERGERLSELGATSSADKAMIAELSRFVEGEARLVEETGRYSVVREVKRTTYEKGDVK